MEFDPQRLAETVERYLGQVLGRWLIRAAVLLGLLGVIGWGGQAFFNDFAANLLWPFLTSLFGATQQGITLDNIESIILVLVIAIVVLVITFAVFSYVVARGFRRRTVPQASIDALANHRSEGIHILNMMPENSDHIDEEARAEFVVHWRNRWIQWRQEVLTTLRANFTVAETLSFQRLGLIPEHAFGFAVNAEHNHYLMQLAKQLVILEDLIQRHQERR